jgi:division protein CdvB (Snf7/Vps24/ESCRT-III family)
LLFRKQRNPYELLSSLLVSIRVSKMRIENLSRRMDFRINELRSKINALESSEVRNLSYTKELEQLIRMRRSLETLSIILERIVLRAETIIVAKMGLDTMRPLVEALKEIKSKWNVNFPEIEESISSIINNLEELPIIERQNQITAKEEAKRILEEAEETVRQKEKSKL